MASRLRRLLALAAAALCAAAGLALIVNAGLPDRGRANAVVPVLAGQTPVAPEEGALAPAIEMTSLDGKHFSLAALRGNPVIVNFWATWCGPCLAETPLLQATYAAFRARRLRVVGIDSGESPADVLAWQSRLGVTYDLLIDRDGSLSAAYRVRGLPSSYLVSADGQIRRIYYGPLDAISLPGALSALGLQP